MITKEIIVPVYSEEIIGEAIANISVQCLKCVHLHKNMTRCEAFLSGIPAKIFTGGFDHTKPFQGDNGIRFEKAI